MNHLFQTTQRGTHRRKSDGVRGNLRSYPLSVNIHPVQKIVNPDDYELWTDNCQAAYNAAKAMFESLPLGKQALWEPVRAKVAEALLAGDNQKAFQILNTVPSLYEGAEADRSMFLALFHNDT